MPRYTPPVISVGEQLTGTTLNTRLDAVATATANIPQTQLDEHATWPSSMFAEDAAPGYWNIHALAFDGNASAAAKTWTLVAPCSGRFLGSSYVDNGTGLTGTFTVNRTLASSGETAAMSANTTINEGDTITVSVAAGRAGTVRFRWRHVGRRG